MAHTLEDWNFTMSEKNGPSVSGWERHLQSGLTALVLAGILWLGNTALENSTTTQVMAVEIKAMARQIDRLEQSQFTATDGARLDRRIDKLEGRIDRVESTHLKNGTM